MISPQGYQLGADPKSKNPFWDENGEDSSVNRIYATATVDNETGVPYVDTSKTVSGRDITFNFDFHNTKGEPGQDGFSPQIILTPIENGYHIKVIDATGEQEVTIANGKDGDTGDPGPEGKPGVDGFSPSASVEQTDSGATITITDASGTTTAYIENGKNGKPGVDGFSPSASVEQTAENQATFTVTDKNGTTSAVLTGKVGKDGEPGTDGFSPDIIVAPIENGYHLTIITESGNQEITIANGTNGQDGFSPSASVEQTGENQATFTVTDKTGTTSAVLTGTKGDQGPAGPGVPAGGTAGQVLTKVDGTDYNTEWKDPEGGSEINFKIYEVDAKVTSWTSDTTKGIYYFEVSDTTLQSILLPSATNIDTTPPIPENKCLSLLVTQPYTSISGVGCTARNFITDISVGTHGYKVGVVGSRTGVVLQAPYDPGAGTYRIKVLYYE